jgi:DNA-binding transcriptional LysR family regulator
MSIENIHIKQLIILRTLLETNNVSKTAKKLNTTQSTISHTLGKLRVELGDELFVMEGRNIKPTVKALNMQSYLIDAIKILRTFDSKVPQFNPEKQKAEFTVILGQYYEIVYLEKLFNILKPYHSTVRINYISSSSNPKEVETLLRTHDADLIVGVTCPVKNCHSQVIQENKYCLMSNKNQKLNDKISFKEYISLPHIILTDHTSNTTLSKVLPKPDPRNIVATIDRLLVAQSLIHNHNYVMTVAGTTAKQITQKYGFDFNFTDVPFKTPTINQYLHRPNAKEDDPQAVWLYEQVLKSLESD